MIDTIWHLEQKLDRLFERGRLMTDAEEQAHWSRYLCVLVSGYIEVSVAEIYSDLAARKSHPAVASNVGSRLRRFQNAKMQQVCNLLRTFDSDVGAAVEDATNGELKDAIDSIVANRNLIAHGADVGISFVRISDYYAKAKTVVRLIEDTCPA